MSETLSTLEYGDVSPPSQSAEVFYSITSHFTKQAKKRQLKTMGKWLLMRAQYRRLCSRSKHGSDKK